MLAYLLQCLFGHLCQDRVSECMGYRAEMLANFNQQGCASKLGNALVNRGFGSELDNILNAPTE